VKAAKIYGIEHDLESFNDVVMVALQRLLGLSTRPSLSAPARWRLAMTVTASRLPAGLPDARRPRQRELPPVLTVCRRTIHPTTGKVVRDDGRAAVSLHLKDEKATDDGRTRPMSACRPTASRTPFEMLSLFGATRSATRRQCRR